ncbi:NAD(P)-binding domain-containing protein, partial [Bacillus paramycoides]
MAKLQIGVVGVGVMGKSLALNFESKGYSVALYDISKEKVNEIIEENRGKNLV